MINEDNEFLKITIEKDQIDDDARVLRHKNLMDKYLGDYVNQKGVIVSFFIFKLFLVDLSMIDANPISLAPALVINFTHSKPDLPVVITSSMIKTFDPFFI